MRALLQRVSRTSVTVEGQIVGRTGPGLLVLACAMKGDDAATAEKLAARIARLRIFRDAAGKMNRSVTDVGGGCLVVSQFTLAADSSSGNRPGFSAAAAPEDGRRLYEHLAASLRQLGLPVETGTFGAEMQVELLNDGPVTIWLDSEAPR